jgi:syntaxin-binding protein 1
MAAYTANNLSNLAAVEQDMATGSSPTGEEIKTQAIISALPALLTDPLISEVDKMRLLMIYIVSQEGILEKDRSKLIDMAKIPVEQQASIVNLKYLGVNLLKVHIYLATQKILGN